ncbi:hydantoinase/oxoprolinase family protein [Mesorhizobium sp. IMUNJ 23232]|uniref:hydantoinase/oxoprolinase family protein n=1 Tax=Mesorhizobium sp. IMUNJ 23232 TaxID=3376064 RepID=UPI0037B4E06D
MNDIDTVDVGVDTGGTFTDLVFRFASGKVRIAKVPSTPSDPARAVLEGILQKAREWNVPIGNVRRVVHGTTVATNAIIERKGSRIGLITTEGFRDVLEIGRQMRQEMYNLRIKPVTPTFLAPRSRRLEVPERLSAAGEVLVPLDEGAVVKAAEMLVADGAQAIAICFLFSFLNPAHERLARELILARFPDIHVSLSCEVDPAVREYERSVATTFDAYVKPIVNGYLTRLEQNLQSGRIDGPFQVMQSRGGLASAEAAREKPVRLVLSGPAGGVIAGRVLCELTDTPNIITVDVGGTSSDIALIRGGEPVIRTEGTIDGFPVRVAMVDVNAIGAGGGSIAWIDEAGGLRVGPHSAGSDPGPACYGRGGMNPTVTDASIVLGYLDPSYFAGGSFALNPDLSRKAIEEKIAAPLRMSVEEAALGIHRVVNSQMAEGIRLVSIKQGFDPRDFALVPMGGGGPIHANALARDLAIRRIVVPNHPGVMAAAGLLTADIEHEAVASVHTALALADMAEIRRDLTDLDAQCEALMVRDGAPSRASRIQHLAEVCYEGQSFNLEVLFDAMAEDGLARLQADFYALHDRVFGQSTDGPIRIVQLKAVHRFRPEGPATIGEASAERRHRARSARHVVLPEIGAVDANIVHRSSLGAGDVVDGPAIVEQEDTTTIIEPGWSGRVTPSGALIVARLDS